MRFLRQIIEILFWAFVTLLWYVYVGYPGLVWVWARRNPRPVRRANKSVDNYKSG